MPKPRTHKSLPQTAPLVRVLEQLVVPAFEEHADDSTGNGRSFEVIDPELESWDLPHVSGQLRGGRLVHVKTQAIDDLHITLQINLHAGHFIYQSAVHALIVGNLLVDTPFHVRADRALGCVGLMNIGCDVIVREDDAPLVSRRIGELQQLADNLDWYFPLRMPNRLAWNEVVALEIDWEDLPHDDLPGFLDEGLKVPPSERTPVTLLRIAQGLDRWQDVLQLLREHPDELPRKECAPLKCLANRQLRRWLPAIRAAREGGIRNGRYPDGKWLSPSYMHALIEGGDEIEALRILGEESDDEPHYHQWLRGCAYHRAGDREQAANAFDCYFVYWPGDVIGQAATDTLVEGEQL